MCSILAYCSSQADPQLVAEMLAKTITRGPDDTRITETGNGFLGFNRLSIMGLTPEGMQPFMLGHNAVVCNGELYGFRKMRDALKKRGYSFRSDSDCEILLPMYREFGTDMFRLLDAEFALVLYDAQAQRYIAARDPVGIRPLYYGQDESGAYVFSSEPKSLVGVCEKIMPFPPGHYAVIDAAEPGDTAAERQGTSIRAGRRSQTRGSSVQSMELHEYRRIWKADGLHQEDLETITAMIREKLLALKEQQKENKRICGNCYNREYDGYVFVDVMGNIFNPRNLSSNFSKLLEMKGLRHIRFHDLRHSCASLLLANDVPMKQIQEWLGHSDISTTANIYSHLDYKSKLTSANVMDNVLTLPETEAVGWRT